MRIDKKQILLFSPLQGKTAQKNLRIMPGQNFNTVIFQQDGKLYYRSEAYIQMLKTVGGFWSAIASLSNIFPNSFRDKMYNFVAGNRLKWFGKRETCRVPTVAERMRFLD